MLDAATATQICDAAERALGLQNTIRYLDMHHWREESAAHHRGVAASSSMPRLESVADHCWHVGVLATLLLPYFPDLNATRVLELCLLHDMLELITGDYDPTGADGTGAGGHAFDATQANAKKQAELHALDTYLAPLPDAAAVLQRTVLAEDIAAASNEARFVKVIDKIQSVIWIRVAKQGRLGQAGHDFLDRYYAKTLPLFPALVPLYDEALARLHGDGIAVAA